MWRVICIKGDFMHPMLYKSLLASALLFLILGLIVMPFLKQGEPAFYANVIGISLLLLFIIGISALQYKDAKKRKIEK